MALPKETTTGEVICECGWLHPEGTPCREQQGNCKANDWAENNAHHQNYLCIDFKPISQTTYGTLLSNKFVVEDSPFVPGCEPRD